MYVKLYGVFKNYFEKLIILNLQQEKVSLDTKIKIKAHIIVKSIKHRSTQNLK